MTTLSRAWIALRTSYRSVLLGIGLLALAACGTPAPIEPVAPPEVPAPKPLDEVSNQLPPDLYPEMPVYPGAKVEHVRKPTHSMREILFSSDAKLDPLVAYYKEHLKKNNFEITSAMVVPSRQGWSCSFYRQGRPGNILLYPSTPDKSRMTIALMYVLPDKPNDMYIEPKEVFDVVGPGEIAQPPANTTATKSASTASKSAK